MQSPVDKAPGGTLRRRVVVGLQVLELAGLLVEPPVIGTLDAEVEELVAVVGVEVIHQLHCGLGHPGGRIHGGNPGAVHSQRPAVSLRPLDQREVEGRDRVLGVAPDPVVGGADRGEVERSVDAVPQLLERRQGGEGGEVRLHQSLAVEPPVVTDRVQVVLVQQERGDHPVLVDRIEGRNAEGGEDRSPADPLSQVEAEADGVLLAVAVRVVVGQRPQHLVQRVEIGGQLHPQVVEPVSAEGEVVGIPTRPRNAPDRALGVDAVADHVPLVGQDVGAMLLQQLVERQQQAVVPVLLLVGYGADAEHVRHRARRDHAVELGDVVLAGHGDNLVPDPGTGLDFLQHRVVVGRRGGHGVDRRHDGSHVRGPFAGSTGARPCRTEQQHGRHGDHCQSLFHVQPP